MSDSLARLLRGVPSGQALPVFPGYCQSVTPLAVQITGAVTLTGLDYLGVPGSLVIGRVLLLRTDGAPVILGNLNSTT
jgi:hypothetical protein